MKDLFTQVCSIETLQTAFERVRANAGCRGSDGVTIARFEYRLESNLGNLHNDLLHQRYHPYPLMRFPIPKRSGKGQRFLSVPTVRDRVAQTAVFLTTREIFEAEFETVSHAYREGRGVRTRLAKKLKDFGPRVQKSVFEADVGEAEFKKLLSILDKVELEKADSIRLYHLCAACASRMSIWGVGEVTEDPDYYIV